jgi:hypothetical protein
MSVRLSGGGGGGGGSGSTTTGSILGTNIAVSVTNSILADTTISIPQSVATNANVKFSTLTANSIGSLNISTTNLSGGTLTATTITATNLNGNNVNVGTLTSTSISATTVSATSLGSLNISITNLSGGTATLTTLTATNINGGAVGVATITATTQSGTTVTVTSLGSLNISTTNLSLTTITASNIGGLNLSVTNLQANTISGANINISTGTFSNIAILSTIANIVQQAVCFIMDGGGSALTTGVAKGFIEIPYIATLDSVTILLDITGNIGIDIWRSTYANFPPSTTNTTITGILTISNAQKGHWDMAAAWTSAIIAGDIIRFNITSASTATNCTVCLDMNRGN